MGVDHMFAGRVWRKTHVLYVLKKLRTKLDLRWRMGVYLGTTGRTNEAYIGTCPGNVVKSRGLARVVQENKWDAERVPCVTGTPLKLCPNDLGNKDSLRIETEIDPHAEPFNPGIGPEAT